MIVLLVIALQALLLGGFYYLAAQERLDIEPLEIALLLTYSVVAVGIAVFIGIMRHRWIEREDRVRQRLLDVIDAIPDPAGVRDIKGRYAMWNKAAESYHGIKAEHVLGKTPFDLFPKDVARNILGLDAECFESNQTVVRRLVLPPLYGKGPRVAQMRIAPVRSAADSGIRGTVTILHDTTASERETAELRHLSTQLKLALDTSGFGSWVWDLETDVLTCSEQFQQLLRYRSNNFRRDFQFRDRLHPDDRERVLAAVQSSLENEKKFSEIYRLQAFDGEYLSFKGSGHVAHDDQGKRYFAGLLVPNIAQP